MSVLTHEARFEPQSTLRWSQFRFFSKSAPRISQEFVEWKGYYQAIVWNKARIKFVARFLLALYAMRTVNLSVLATAISGHAKEESNYKRLQGFLREFEMPYAELALFIVKLLGVPGPYKLALDRTNWKVGAVDLNTLTLSIVYRGVGNQPPSSVSFR
jgi:hypothetical protein